MDGLDDGSVLDLPLHQDFCMSYRLARPGEWVYKEKMASSSITEDGRVLLCECSGEHGCDDGSVLDLFSLGDSRMSNRLVMSG